MNKQTKMKQSQTNETNKQTKTTQNKTNKQMSDIESMDTQEEFPQGTLAKLCEQEQTVSPIVPDVPNYQKEIRKAQCKIVVNCLAIAFGIVVLVLVLS